MELKRNSWLLYALSLVFILLVWGRGDNVFGWAAYNAAFYVVLPLAVGYLLGFKPRELGFQLGNREGYKWFAVLFLLSIPISLYGTRVPEMKNYYPIFAYSNWIDFLLKELAVGAIMFAHEAFYRGILLFPLAKKNEWLAILAQDVPYTLVHIGKPGIEILYAFFAGIVFAKMDLKGKSFLPSFLLHWFGSVLFDVMCILL
ncbi:membrane-associated metalloprotease [Thermococcus onnurineus NA1]|uniref:Membrane-associated metalloprotease n=1 Tax=Thermococcus onnurineus (strain NA1) TaxID=523850 RepID=B6YUQ5_THEON|nr:CPBP family archaeomyxosortase MrtA [Thermococcus onnurineus]ACJ16091.1 membrane-associated metalloprotease [Thermococcus onnurineus NA1]